MKYKLLIYGIMAAMAFCTTSCYSDFDNRLQPKSGLMLTLRPMGVKSSP